MILKQRTALLLTLILIVAAWIAIEVRLRSIEVEINFREAMSVRVSDDQARATSILDRPMLTMEMPQRDTDIELLAPPATRKLWKGTIAWDFVFTLGYVLLLTTLPFAGDGARTVSFWESVSHLALIAGILDFAENISILTLLHYLDVGKKIFGTRAFVVLPLFGAAKWFFFFLTCRALAKHFAQFKRWRAASVALHALVTAGTWATLFSLVGLPARPVLGFVIIAISLLLLAITVLRLIREDPGPPIPEFVGIQGRGEAIRVRRGMIDEGTTTTSA